MQCWACAGDRTQGKLTCLTRTSHWVQSSELQTYDIEDGQFLKCQNYLVLTLWEELVGHIGLVMQHISQVIAHYHLHQNQMGRGKSKHVSITAWALTTAWSPTIIWTPAKPGV